jgi:hypothetical protein
VITINGIIEPGLGAATRTVALQMRHFLIYEPRLQYCHHGTLNVRLDTPTIVSRWEITTRGIAWDPHRPKFHEIFDFIETSFIYNEIAHVGWIYSPRGSPNRSAIIKEVLTENIPLSDDLRCSITIDRPHRIVVLNGIRHLVIG